MKVSDLFQMRFQRFFDSLRKHRYPVFLSFSASDHNLAVFKIDILDPEPNALHLSKPRSIKKAGHQPRFQRHFRQHLRNFGTGQHRRQVLFLSGPHKAFQFTDFPSQHMPIQKIDRRKGLGLRPRARGPEGRAAAGEPVPAEQVLEPATEQVGVLLELVEVVAEQGWVLVRAEQVQAPLELVVQGPWSGDIDLPGRQTIYRPVQERQGPRKRNVELSFREKVCGGIQERQIPAKGDFLIAPGVPIQRSAEKLF